MRKSLRDLLRKYKLHILPWFCHQIKKCQIKVMFLISSTLTTNCPQQSLRASETWSSDKSVISATSCIASLAQQSPANQWKMLLQRENGSSWSTCRCRLIRPVYSVLAFSDSELVRKNHVWWQAPKHQQTVPLQQQNLLLHMSNNTLNMLQSGSQNRLTISLCLSPTEQRFRIAFLCLCGLSKFCKSAEFECGNDQWLDTDAVLLQWNVLWLWKKKNTKDII